MSKRTPYNIKSIAIMIIVIGFFYAIKSQFPHYKVSSQSMAPGFVEGDVVLSSNLFDKATIKRNEVCFVNHKEEVHITRIVGLPGDKIEIKDGVLFVNNQEEKNITTKFRYKVITNSKYYELNRRRYKLLKSNPFGEYAANLTEREAKEIAQDDFVKSVYKVVHPNGYDYAFSDNPIYPHHSSLKWSRDNFGPIYIPENGKFKNNYYFFLGDNRHESLDSRDWGLIPEIDIDGKLISKLYSKNK